MRLRFPGRHERVWDLAVLLLSVAILLGTCKWGKALAQRLLTFNILIGENRFRFALARRLQWNHRRAMKNASDHRPRNLL